MILLCVWCNSHEQQPSDQPSSWLGRMPYSMQHCNRLAQQVQSMLHMCVRPYHGPYLQSHPVRVCKVPQRPGLHLTAPSQDPSEPVSLLAIQPLHVDLWQTGCTAGNPGPKVRQQSPCAYTTDEESINRKIMCLSIYVLGLCFVPVTELACAVDCMAGRNGPHIWAVSVQGAQYTT